MSNEKDTTEKILLNCNDVFADVVNVFLCDGEPVVDQHDLTDSATTSQFKADDQVHQQERDVAKFWSKAGTRIAILGVENQTKPDADMPMRAISYDGASYKEQVLQHDAARKDKTKKIKPLPPYPAVTLVLNFGKTPWNQPKSLLGCIGEHNIPEAIRPYVNDYKLHVFDIVSLKKEDLDKFKSDFQHVAKVLWAEYHNVPYEPSGPNLVHADQTLKTIAALTHSNEVLEAYRNIPQAEREGGIDMCRVVNEFIERGIKLGEERGIKLGEERGIKLGEERGKNDILELAGKVISSYRRTNSVPEAAKENNISEEEASFILKKLQMFPL